MNIELTPELIEFRGEVRAFLCEELTEEMITGQAMGAGIWPEPHVSLAWQRALNRRGWLAPLWPVKYGGNGWTGIQRFILDTESGMAGAPLVNPMGVRMLGPVLIEFGNDEQREFYLPRILSSEDYWCQGFSEPGSGSDLASLSTRAILEDDHYVVNGSKMWTTHAHHANRMFALVRTDPSARKQEGIGFLLIDLDTPGIEVKPIISIGGDHDVNQVFFQDVRVPRANMVGDPRQGWAYAKFLLEFERGAGLNAGRLRSALKRVERAIEEQERLGFTSPDRAGLRRRMAELTVDIDVFEFLELKTLGPLLPGETPGPVSSILKLRNARLKQAMAELGIQALGDRAAVWAEEPSSVADVIVPDYLNSRAFSIFGGSKEVQLGIIARHLVGV